MISILNFNDYFTGGWRCYRKFFKNTMVGGASSENMITTVLSKSNIGSPMLHVKWNHVTHKLEWKGGVTKMSCCLLFNQSLEPAQTNLMGIFLRHESINWLQINFTLNFICLLSFSISVHLKPGGPPPPPRNLPLFSSLAGYQFILLQCSGTHAVL